MAVGQCIVHGIVLCLVARSLIVTGAVAAVRIVEAGHIALERLIVIYGDAFAYTLHRVVHGRYVLSRTVLLEDYVEQVGHGSGSRVGDFICKCCRVVVTHDGTVDGQVADECTWLQDTEESAVRLEVVDGKATAVEPTVVARLADGSQLDAAHVDVVRQHGVGIRLTAIHDLSKAVEVGCVLNLICAVHELGSRGIVVHVGLAKQIYLLVCGVGDRIFVGAQRLEPCSVLRGLAVEQISQFAALQLLLGHLSGLLAGEVVAVYHPSVVVAIEGLAAIVARNGGCTPAVLDETL